MAIATFASKVFEVNGDKIYTFSDFQYSAAIQTEKQDNNGSKPATYNKGPDLDNFSFKVSLDISLGINPRAEFDSWNEILRAGTPYLFIIGGRPISQNKFILVSVGYSNAIIDNKGNYTHLDLDLKFDEYFKEGHAEDKEGKGGKKGKGKKKESLEGLSENEFGVLLEE